MCVHHTDMDSSLLECCTMSTDKQYLLLYQSTVSNIPDNMNLQQYCFKIFKSLTKKQFGRYIMHVQAFHSSSSAHFLLLCETTSAK